MDESAILVERRGRTGVVTLNRPAKRNAINHELASGLEAALADLAGDPGVHVVVLKGAGPAFCAGHDLDGGPYMSFPEGETRWTVGAGLKLAERVRRLYESIWDCPKPVVAQVHGHCLAGGMYLMMLCDLAIASETALIGEPAMRLGGVTSLPLWNWILGPRRAADMLFTGRVVTGREALEMGLVTRCCPEAELEAQTMAIADQIGDASIEMLRAKKEAWHTALDMSGLRAQFRYFSQLNGLSRMAHPDDTSGEGMRRLMRERKQAKERGESTAY